MARFKDKEKALVLRKQGKSYSQIKAILGIPKSTLSYWLRNFPLSKQRIRVLRDCNEQRIERFRETMRKKREVRLGQYYQEQKKLIFPLNERELYLSGLFLYWGEGSKSFRPTVGVTNTDPAIIKFFIVWITKLLKVPRMKLKIQLHLYADMKIKREIEFWVKELQIPISQFSKPYIKKTLSENINHNKGGFGHGTCNVRIGDARLSEKILMAIQSITDYYNKTGA